LYLFFLYLFLVSEPIGPPSPTEKCPDNLATICNLQCANDNYALDNKGCPICACASDQSIKRIGRPPTKSTGVECSPVKCRMFCAYGFNRDENGCEICKCNDSPQPCPQLNCANTCLNGYRKDSSGKMI